MTIAILPQHAQACLPWVRHFFDTANFAEQEDEFLRLSQQAKQIIIHPWLRTKDIEKIGDSQIAAKQLAKKVLDNNADVVIFSPPIGGSYQAPIHSLDRVKIIYSLTEIKS